MSDTVNLIIEIPKEAYNVLLTRQILPSRLDVVGLLIHGISLDSVKAEIKKNILDEPVENGTNAEMACYNGGLLKCLEIIDKHIGKGETEVKPNDSMGTMV